MNKEWQTDSCENVRAYFSIYPVPVAAALWCGIPANEVDGHLKEATVVYRAVLGHPYIPCLEPRCRAIHDAIDKGILPVSRENGSVCNDHVAPERRHVSRQHLKEWIAKEFPADKPAFLFDEVERKTHSAFDKDSFLALQANLEATRQKLKEAQAKIIAVTSERDADLGELNSLRKMADDTKDVGDRSATTYLNIIGGLLGLLRTDSPMGVKALYESDNAVISALLAYHEGKPGISSTTLESKFPEAKRSLKATAKSS